MVHTKYSLTIGFAATHTAFGAPASRHRSRLDLQDGISIKHGINVYCNEQQHLGFSAFGIFMCLYHCVRGTAYTLGWRFWPCSSSLIFFEKKLLARVESLDGKRTLRPFFLLQLLFFDTEFWL
jgi:hypothetical protein